MAMRGQVFWPNALLPPEQKNKHPCVVLFSRAHGQFAGAHGVWLTVAIIRSALKQNGTPVHMIMGHSIPIPAGTLPSIVHDSILETHQLFAMNSRDLQNSNSIGTLPADLLDQALAGARRLFTQG